MRGYWEAGVRHIVALRGDPQEGLGAKFCPHPDGYESSCALVAGIKRVADFEISVSAYPERHPESLSLDADIDFLRAKVDAGANRAITQFFFENEIYLRLSRKAARAGESISRSCPASCRCRTSSRPRASPKRPARAYRNGSPIASKDWMTTLRRAGSSPATVAAEQVLGLVDHGVRDFHFYTNNRADLVYAICHLLGLRPKLEQKAAE